MIKKICVLIVMTILAGLLLVGCGVNGIFVNSGIVIGSGPVVSKNFENTGFSEIEISSNFIYEITQSKDFSVNVSVRQNILDFVDVYQSGSTLYVHLKPGSFNHTEARVVITLPEIHRLAVSGATSGNLRGFQQNSEFALKLSGASRLDLSAVMGNAEMVISGASRVTGTLQAANLIAEISGASRCDLTGRADSTELQISGASQAELSGLQLQAATVKLTGASRASIDARGSLDLEVSGASTLNYTGNPSVTKVNVSGASKINHQ